MSKTIILRSIPTDNDDAVLTAAEMAQWLGVSPITLLRMRQRPGCGGLPYIQISEGRVGYVQRDGRAYLAARRVGVLAAAVEHEG